MVNLFPPGVAAVQWKTTDGLSHIRVFFQRDDGFIYQSSWNQNRGWDPNLTGVARGRIGTSLAAVYNGISNLKILLYYTSPDNGLWEASYDDNEGTWIEGRPIVPGSLGEVLPTTSIAAATSKGGDGTLEVKVFYQQTDLRLRWLAYSQGRWSRSTIFTVPVYPGGSITAGGGADTRIYYQAYDTTISEIAFTGSYKFVEIRHSLSIPPRAGLGSVVWKGPGGSINARVYFPDDSGVIQEWANNGGGWAPPTVPTPDAVTGYRFPLVASGEDTNNTPGIKIYLQSTSQNALTELRWTALTGWAIGTLPF